MSDRVFVKPSLTATVEFWGAEWSSNPHQHQQHQIKLSDSSKMKLLDTHSQKPLIVTAERDGKIILWDYSRKCPIVNGTIYSLVNSALNIQSQLSSIAVSKVNAYASNGAVINRQTLRSNMRSKGKLLCARTPSTGFVTEHGSPAIDGFSLTAALRFDAALCASASPSGGSADSTQLHKLKQQIGFIRQVTFLGTNNELLSQNMVEAQVHGLRSPSQQVDYQSQQRFDVAAACTATENVLIVVCDHAVILFDYITHRLRLALSAAELGPKCNPTCAEGLPFACCAVSCNDGSIRFWQFGGGGSGSRSGSGSGGGGAQNQQLGSLSAHGRSEVAVLRWLPTRSNLGDKKDSMGSTLRMLSIGADGVGLLWELPVHHGVIRCAGVAPLARLRESLGPGLSRQNLSVDVDHNMLLVCSNERKIKLWDLDDLKTAKLRQARMRSGSGGGSGSVSGGSDVSSSVSASPARQSRALSSRGMSMSLGSGSAAGSGGAGGGGGGGGGADVYSLPCVSVVKPNKGLRSGNYNKIAAFTALHEPYFTLGTFLVAAKTNVLGIMQNREGGVVGTDEDSERSSVVGAGGAGAGASSEKLSLQHELSLRSLMAEYLRRLTAHPTSSDSPHLLAALSANSAADIASAMGGAGAGAGDGGVGGASGADTGAASGTTGGATAASSGSSSGAGTGAGAGVGGGSIWAEATDPQARVYSLCPIGPAQPGLFALATSIGMVLLKINHITSGSCSASHALWGRVKLAHADYTVKKMLLDNSARRAFANSTSTSASISGTAATGAEAHHALHPSRSSGYEAIVENIQDMSLLEQVSSSSSDLGIGGGGGGGGGVMSGSKLTAAALMKRQLSSRRAPSRGTSTGNLLGPSVASVGVGCSRPVFFPSPSGRFCAVVWYDSMVYVVLEMNIPVSNDDGPVPDDGSSRGSTGPAIEAFTAAGKRMQEKRREAQEQRRLDQYQRGMVEIDRGSCVEFGWVGTEDCYLIKTGASIMSYAPQKGRRGSVSSLLFGARKDVHTVLPPQLLLKQCISADAVQEEQEEEGGGGAGNQHGQVRSLTLGQTALHSTGSSAPAAMAATAAAAVAAAAAAVTAAAASTSAISDSTGETAPASASSTVPVVVPESLQSSICAEVITSLHGGPLLAASIMFGPAAEELLQKAERAQEKLHPGCDEEDPDVAAAMAAAVQAAAAAAAASSGGGGKGKGKGAGTGGGGGGGGEGKILPKVPPGEIIVEDPDQEAERWRSQPHVPPCHQVTRFFALVREEWVQQQLLETTRRAAETTATAALAAVAQERGKRRKSVVASAAASGALPTGEEAIGVACSAAVNRYMRRHSSSGYRLVPVGPAMQCMELVRWDLARGLCAAVAAGHGGGVVNIFKLGLSDASDVSDAGHGYGHGYRNVGTGMSVGTDPARALNLTMQTIASVDIGSPVGIHRSVSDLLWADGVLFATRNAANDVTMVLFHHSQQQEQPTTASSSTSTSMGVGVGGGAHHAVATAAPAVAATPSVCRIPFTPTLSMSGSGGIIGAVAGQLHGSRAGLYGHSLSSRVDILGVHHGCIYLAERDGSVRSLPIAVCSPVAATALLSHRLEQAMVTHRNNGTGRDPDGGAEGGAGAGSDWQQDICSPAAEELLSLWTSLCNPLPQCPSPSPDLIDSSAGAGAGAVDGMQTPESAPMNTIVSLSCLEQQQLLSILLMQRADASRVLKLPVERASPPLAACLGEARAQAALNYLRTATSAATATPTAAATSSATATKVPGIVRQYYGIM